MPMQVTSASRSFTELQNTSLWAHEGAVSDAIFALISKNDKIKGQFFTFGNSSVQKGIFACNFQYNAIDDVLPSSCNLTKDVSGMVGLYDYILHIPNSEYVLTLNAIIDNFKNTGNPKIILVPVHLNGNHWTMLSIDIEAKKIDYFDSYGDSSTNIAKYAKDIGYAYSYNAEKIQYNTYDCGFFAARAAEMKAEEALGHDISLTKAKLEDKKNIRKNICDLFKKDYDKDFPEGLPRSINVKLAEMNHSTIASLDGGETVVSPFSSKSSILINELVDINVQKIELDTGQKHKSLILAH